MAQEKQQTKQLIRVMNTDLEGHVPIAKALTKVKGVDFMYANAVCTAIDYPSSTKAGDLSDEKVKELNDIVKYPAKYGIPTWLLNRKRDPETGEDRHILSSDLDYIKSNDIKHLQKIKTHKGIRHSSRLPLRGQRTKANFRGKKGKGSLGVKRKKK